MTQVLDAASATESAPAGSADERQPGLSDLQCPECPYVGRTEAGLKIHFRMKHKGSPEPEWTERPRQLPPDEPAQREQVGEPGATLPPRIPKDLNAVGKKLEESLKTAAGFLFMFGLQVTGVVITNRAARLSREAMVYAERNEAVMRAIEAFNGLMGATELARLGGDVALGLGVDVGMLHPAKPVRFGPIHGPGFVVLQSIGKDLSEVAQIRMETDRLEQEFQRQQAAAAAAAANGQADAGAGQ